MSSKMLRIQLSELKIVRIKCKKCEANGRGGIIEVPIEYLDGAMKKGTCYFCQSELLPEHGPTPLNNLKNAIAELKRKNDDFEVEFEIPFPE